MPMLMLILVIVGIVDQLLVVTIVLGVELVDGIFVELVGHVNPDVIE